MSPNKQNSRTLPRTGAEWVSLSVSLILLATVVGMIVWLWVREPTGPARFKIERGEMRSEEGLSHLPMTVTNVGGTAAREIRVEGKLSAADLKAASQKSCGVLNKMGPQIQWIQSYVTDDKVYCVYLAPSEAAIRQHANESGFPANSIAQVRNVIEPATAE